MPSETLIADIPSQFFSNKFPGISEKYGEAVQEEKNKDGKPVVRDIGEDFFAACLGAEGMPETPTVYMPAEDRFYTYIPNQGIYGETREAELSAKLSQLLLECARACKEGTDTKKLEFNLRDSASLVGIIKRAKGLLAVPVDYFADESCKFITCNNGVLRIEDKKLLPFSPKFRRRNKLSVNFDCSAKCPLFLEQLMRPALSEEDLSLLQTWCGLALLGINYAQKLIILSGTAGGGKGTFIRVL
ncbi:MAG: hypothetical protein JWR69_4402, partial [Pedosphaera sp.]|nr:hypothetical protein [Pedosphaera sp.]